MVQNRAVEHRNRILGILCLPIAFFVFMSLMTYSTNDYPNSSLSADEALNTGGQAGALVSTVLLLTLGYGAYGIPLLIAYWGWNRIRNESPVLLATSLVMSAIIILGGDTLIGLSESLSPEQRFGMGGSIGLRLAQLATTVIEPRYARLGIGAIVSLPVLILALWSARRRKTRTRPSSRNLTDESQHMEISPVTLPDSSS